MRKLWPQTLNTNWTVHEAIKFLLTANQIMPDHSDNRDSRHGQLDAGHLDAAEKWYRAALVKDPNDVAVLDA